MALLRFVDHALRGRRLERLRALATDPGTSQARTLQRLLRATAYTTFGQAHRLVAELGVDGYQEIVPLGGFDEEALADVPPLEALFFRDRPAHHDLLPILDQGVFFEFVPAAEWGQKRPRRIPLVAVQPESVYALVVTAGGRVWSQPAGHLLRTTTIRPYRFLRVGSARGEGELEPVSPGLCTPIPAA